MTHYQSVIIKCGICGSSVLLFPRSKRKTYIVLNRLNGNRVVIYNENPPRVWYEGGHEFDKLLCKNCEQEVTAVPF
jgi:hypothetical protein